MEQVSFSDIAIVACGTMSLELNYLKEKGFLDTEHLYFTTPGLHQDIYWDGRNGVGEMVMNGVYYLVLETRINGGERRYKRKVSVVR